MDSQLHAKETKRAVFFRLTNVSGEEILPDIACVEIYFQYVCRPLCPSVKVKKVRKHFGLDALLSSPKCSTLSCVLIFPQHHKNGLYSDPTLLLYSVSSFPVLTSVPSRLY